MGKRPAGAIFEPSAVIVTAARAMSHEYEFGGH
ncbi:hypothetical protein RCH11_003565 [Glaciihabitans sp. GrIS 2.15]|nr:hypothetical protein [Glaciihabitans sp. GrIS 2.15]